MSYELLNKRTRTAAKEHRCIWCCGSIPTGEKHVHEVSKWEGDFQDHRWHAECDAAANEFFKREGSCEFYPGQFARGSSESAD